MAPSDLGTMGEFLAAQRARLAPDAESELGPSRRRVPGLRREEIALLAGVSASYYTRLEQGQATSASPQVVDALARALRLSGPEREHLHALAKAATRPIADVEPPEETAGAELTELLAAIRTPAMVLGRRRDILAWNPSGHALFGAHLDPLDVDDPDRRPNATSLLFLDAATRELYVDWDKKAAASVGHLRMLAAQHPSDARLTALVGRLTVRSDAFATIWASQRVRDSSSDSYRMHHPLVGDLTVTQQTLAFPAAPGRTVVICTAAAESASAQALDLLGRLVAPQSVRTAPARPTQGRPDL